MCEGLADYQISADFFETLDYEVADADTASRVEANDQKTVQPCNL